MTATQRAVEALTQRAIEALSHRGSVGAKLRAAGALLGELTEDEEDDRDADIRQGSTVAGLSAAGALLTGVLGIIGCMIATIGNEFTGGGAYLLAAAVAFGLLASAAFRR